MCHNRVKLSKITLSFLSKWVNFVIFVFTEAKEMGTCVVVVLHQAAINKVPKDIILNCRHTGSSLVLDAFFCLNNSSVRDERSDTRPGLKTASV